MTFSLHGHCSAVSGIFVLLVPSGWLGHSVCVTQYCRSPCSSAMKGEPKKAASSLLQSMRCDNHEDISAGTYAPALFSKGRNVPVTLPSNTVCRDDEFHSSGSIQLSRITILIPGSLGTHAEETIPGQHIHGTSLYVEATRLPSLLRSFAW